MVATSFVSASASSFGAAADVASGAFVATTDDRVDWRAAPIAPDWVLAGRPIARFVPLARGRDDQATTTLWDCTAGTFRWHFGWDETVHILDGAVEVTLPSGEVHRLTAGSVAFFPAGSSAVWKVEGYVRKLAVCRRAFPAPVLKTLAIAGALRRAPGRSIAAVAGLGAHLPTLSAVRHRVALALALTLGLVLDLI